jgi:hypothetical protein
LESGEGVGCDFELFPAVGDEGSTQPQAREGRLSGKFYRQSSEYATGRARNGVPPQSPLRLRTGEDDGFDTFGFSRETMTDFHSYCAFIPSGFERSCILERASQSATSPAYLARGVKSDCDHSYRRFYDGIWGDFSSLRTWVRVGTTSSTFGAQPIRRQVVEEAASGGLSSVSGWSYGCCLFPTVGIL